MAFDKDSPGFLEEFESAPSMLVMGLNISRPSSPTEPMDFNTAIGYSTVDPTDDARFSLSQEQGPALFEPLSHVDTLPIAPPINRCLWPGCRSIQKNFLTSNDLDFHIQTHHIRSCPWPTCNIQRSFRRRSDLLRHMESVHSGTRRFMCELPGCDKAYSRKDKLTAHKRSHLREHSPKPGLPQSIGPQASFVPPVGSTSPFEVRETNSYHSPSSSSYLDIGAQRALVHCSRANGRQTLEDKYHGFAVRDQGLPSKVAVPAIGISTKSQLYLDRDVLDGP
jgi:hypothetical protein